MLNKKLLEILIGVIDAKLVGEKKGENEIIVLVDL